MAPRVLVRVRRVTGDWQLVDRLGRLDVEAVAAAHALAEDVYASHAAAVPWLVSRAELAASSGSLADPAAVARAHDAAARLLSQANEALDRHGATGLPGCLMVWDIGHQVVEPLLRSHGRVAVLLVDALRADLGAELAARLAGVLPGRTITRRLAVVPAPTRTAEALAALASGIPLPAGSAGSAPRVRAGRALGADRDYHATALRELWSGGPPLSVAVTTAVDERLHRTSAELGALLADAVSGLERRLLPSLAALPGEVPFVVLADHGFRENPSWGRGPEGRYVHGGTSLEECVVPVIVAGARQQA
ncbi:MAG: hypothetical protein M0Z40_00100 [Actinomycetota bacterium]|nr:hypothetical protein [Actinomycetota bacterium]